MRLIMDEENLKFEKTGLRWIGDCLQGYFYQLNGKFKKNMLLLKPDVASLQAGGECLAQTTYNTQKYENMGTCKMLE